MQKNTLAAVLSSLDKAHNRTLENADMLDSVLRSKDVLTTEEKRSLFDALDHLSNANTILAELLDGLRNRSNGHN